MKSFAVTVLTLLVLTNPIGAQTIVEHGATAPLHTSGASIAPGNAFSGQCCEPDVSCCASLWANYCQEKRDCCNSHCLSPRRSVCGHPSCIGGCCGFPFQMGDCCPKLCLPSFRGFRLHRACSDDCAAPGCSASDASCAADFMTNDYGGTIAPAPDGAIGSGVTPSDEGADAAPPQPEPADEADVPPPAPAPPPPPEDSARRWFRPFPWVK